VSGYELLRRLYDASHRLPAIMITGHSDAPMVVQAMKAGASDFIEKPIGRGELLDSIERALDPAMDSNNLVAWRESATHHRAGLTARQRQIMELVKRRAAAYSRRHASNAGRRLQLPRVQDRCVCWYLHVLGTTTYFVPMPRKPPTDSAAKGIFSRGQRFSRRSFPQLR
jgi:DNA-binding response OmpR family regulator